MNNEIKEINIKIPGQILDYVDTKEHLLDLFNYITNLQKENERLKESIGELTNRNIKASVYIQENIIGNYFKRYDNEIYKICDDLLDILKGEPNE